MFFCYVNVKVGTLNYSVINVNSKHRANWNEDLNIEKHFFPCRIGCVHFFIVIVSYSIECDSIIHTLLRDD